MITVGTRVQRFGHFNTTYIVVAIRSELSPFTGAARDVATLRADNGATIEAPLAT